jgi:hypothetical protein
MRKLILLTLTALIVASPAAAKHKATPAKAKAAVAQAELKWVDGAPGLPGGVQMAVVKGDPGKKGMFTIRLKMPANYAVRPHWHPTDEHVTLVSGKLIYGMSDELDRSGGQALAQGAGVTMKAKQHHWVFTGDGAEVEVSAIGPFAITYVNPADDPRGAGKKPTK